MRIFVSSRTFECGTYIYIFNGFLDGMLDGCETAYNFVTCATKLDPKIVSLVN